MKLKNTLILLTIFINSVTISAQNNTLISNRFIQNHTLASFFQSKVSQQVLDYKNLDLDLLEATIIFTINQKRTKKHRSTFTSSSTLNQFAKEMLKSLRGNSLKPEKKYKSRNQKKLKRTKQNADFEGTYVDFIFDYQPVIRHQQGKGYHYDKDNPNAEVPFFHGNKKRKKTERIPAKTYQDFVDNFLKRTQRIGSNTLLTSKAFSEIGCATEFYQKEIYRMPYLKVFLIVGGYRLGRITDKS